jgi:hypothetical protein
LLSSQLSLLRLVRPGLHNLAIQQSTVPIAHHNPIAGPINRSTPIPARTPLLVEIFFRLRGEMTRRRSAPSHFNQAARDAWGFCAGAAAIEGSTMNPGLKAASVIAVVLVVALTSNWASAQGNQDRMIEQYTCKDVMRESGASRDVAIAFLRGFLLGKSGSTKFNIDVLHKQSDEFIERCLANPDEKAMEAMSRIIG